MDNTLDNEKNKAHDVTASAIAAGETGNVGRPVTHEENKHILRKIDSRLLPLMCITVFLQFLDKTSLNYANLLGIKTDLGLVGQDYSWCSSILYFGWLAASPIHGYFLQHVHLSRYTAVITLLWGVVLASHAATHSFAGLMCARFFLGALEGGITPAYILMVGRFYRRQEQVARTGLWFLQNGTAQIVGGLISYGLLERTSHSNSFALWRQLYIILGGITVIYAVLVYIYMPADPVSAKFLTATEKELAVERLRENKTGISDKHFKWAQFWEALADVRIYLFFLGVLSANISNGGVTNFGSQIIGAFGFDKKKTALLGMTTGGAEIVAVLLGIALASWTRTRVVPGVFSFLIAIIGSTLMIALPASNKAGRMAGYAIVYWYPVASPFYYSWLSSCVSGETKKITFNVLLQIGYCVGNIIGPQTYRASDAPDYLPAKAAMIAMFALSALCLVGISAVHFFENRARNKKGEFGEDEPENVEFMDWTDKEMRSFRYPY